MEIPEYEENPGSHDEESGIFCDLTRFGHANPTTGCACPLGAVMNLRQARPIEQGDQGAVPNSDRGYPGANLSNVCTSSFVKISAGIRRSLFGGTVPFGGRGGILRGTVHTFLKIGFTIIRISRHAIGLQSHIWRGFMPNECK